MTCSFKHGLRLLAAGLTLVLALAMCRCAHAELPPGFDAIPAVSYLYRFKLEREVTARLGDAGATSRIAAQIHMESRWQADAHSGSNAQGMLQFIPSTASWLRTVCPEIGAPDPWDPNWSMRAGVCYDAYLHARVSGVTECDRWAFTLSAYNGGMFWLQRDQTLAAAKGLDAKRWFGHVEVAASRGAAAQAQNRAYAHNILLVLEPVYLQAGWPGEAVCK